MKLTDLRNLINEEIQYVLNEAVARPNRAGRGVQMGTLKPSNKKDGKGNYFGYDIFIPKTVLKQFGNELYLKTGSNPELFISERLKKLFSKETTGDKDMLRILNTLPEKLRTNLRNILKLSADKPQGEVFLNDKLHPISKKYLIRSKIKQITDDDIIFYSPSGGNLSNITKEGLINEVMNALQEEPPMPIDEIGKLYQVLLPDGKMTKEEMVCEVTVFDEIISEKTSGVFKNPSEARRHAGEILKEYDDRLEEVKAAMEEYRKSKADVDAKKNETIGKIKNIHNKK